MNVLLTGAFGFLGSQIRTGLELPICTLGRRAGDIRCDLRNNVPLIDVTPDIVVHAAGKAHSIPSTAEQAQEFFEANVQGTINLTRALDAGRSMPRSLVLISTVAVYGRDSGEQIDETAPTNGTSPYALSKIDCESYVTDWGSRNGVRVAILRLPLVAGPNPPGNLETMINAIAKNRYLSIGKGRARKSIVLGIDVAKIIPAAALKGGIFNLTDGYHPTIGELETLISSQLKKTPPRSIPVWLGSSLGRIGDIFGDAAPINSDVVRKVTSTLTFSDALARDQLGWSPRPVLEHFCVS